MDVVEQDTFDFGAHCHGGIRYIDGPATPSANRDDVGASPSYAVGPITVTENGVAAPIASESTGFVKWGDANVEVFGQHLYELRYHVTDVIVVAPDAAVLYWQFLGNGFPRLDAASVTVHLPGNGLVRAFVHGDHNGVSRVDDHTITALIAPNPAGSILEVRSLQAPSDFTAAPSGPPITNRIVSLEQSYAATNSNFS